MFSIMMSRLDTNDKNIRFSQSTKETNIARCFLIRRSILHSVQSRTLLYYQAMPAVPQTQESIPPAHVCAVYAPGSRSNLSNFWHHPNLYNRLVQVREHRRGSPVKFPSQTAEGSSSPRWKEEGTSLLHHLKMSCHPILPSATNLYRQTMEQTSWAHIAFSKFQRFRRVPPSFAAPASLPQSKLEMNLLVFHSQTPEQSVLFSPTALAAAFARFHSWVRVL